MRTSIHLSGALRLAVGALSSFGLLMGTLPLVVAAQYGAIDRGIVYSPPGTVVGVEDPRCARLQMKAYNNCRFSMMKRDGATLRAVRFAAALTAYRGYFGYATSVSPGRFGPVALVGTLPSGFSTYGSEYLVTPRGRFINPDEVSARDEAAASRNDVFRRLRRAHPRATVFPQGGFVETRGPGGGQRFVVTHPIVEGCHACPLLGAARYAYDFGPNGESRGVTLLGVRAGKRAWFGY